MQSAYAMTIMMKKRLAILALAAVLAVDGISITASAQPGPGPGGPGGSPGPGRFRSDQDAARRAMLEGNVMPFSVLKRRVEAQMGGDADYLGSEFIPERNRYRLKYMRDRNVVWVDVDGRTGDIIGWAGR
ncbi:MAG TPA: PepSY domain-containing protein [Sphingobium sp.]|uniref:PepSY domain-containing protein n=1 Tax=Sphingobium sp. TaxID=1912891 RepID=UPI002ED54686